jgi:hypothetical protein
MKFTYLKNNLISNKQKNELYVKTLSHFVIFFFYKKDCANFFFSLNLYLSELECQKVCKIKCYLKLSSSGT